MSLPTILLISPSDELYLVLQEHLHNRYRIFFAPAPEEDSELLLCKSDILILDLFLPRTDGFSFLKEHVKAIPPSVLLLTTFADQVILDAASSLGVDKILLKPINITAVLKWLDTLHK